MTASCRTTYRKPGIWLAGFTIITLYAVIGYFRLKRRVYDATRESEELLVGVSTRGAISLCRAAQAFALMENRDFVVPDDVKSLAVAVLSHRVMPTTFSHGNRREAVESLLERIVETVSVPV